MNSNVGFWEPKPGKCYYLMIHKDIDNESIELGCKTLYAKAEQKLLGIIVVTDLNFQGHAKLIIKAANPKCFFSLIFLSWTCTSDKTAGEGISHFFNSFIPLHRRSDINRVITAESSFWKLPVTGLETTSFGFQEQVTNH